MPKTRVIIVFKCKEKIGVYRDAQLNFAIYDLES